MTLNLKTLSKEAIPHALERAERYRLLNEPTEAESICHDVLNLDPVNQKALVILLLAITDQYHHGQGAAIMNARDVLPRLQSKYDQMYYAGIIAERKAKATLRDNLLGSNFLAYELLQEALDCFQEAEKIRPPGNDDSILRWNTCVRMIERHKLKAPPQERDELPLE